MATEFTVSIEDRPGALAHLAEALAQNGINITAIHATPCPGQGFVQLITNNNDATVNALRDARIDYTVREVLLVNLVDQPGSLAQLARRLADAGININAVYINMRGQIVLDTDDLPRAQRVALGLASDRGAVRGGE
ncbi:MAG: ACT domain-containing protein [Anaerolineae bacterium]|nr:ACT domain-containing protein [Anaerolineae bacterium]